MNFDHAIRRDEPHAMDSDPSRLDYLYIENLATAYWHSEVLFSALELRLFSHMEAGKSTIQTLSRAVSCKENGLYRLLNVMKQMGLIGEIDGTWFNSQSARLYLVESSPSYMGDFFLYRRTMQDNFRLLTRKISLNDDRNQKDGQLNTTDDYAIRNFNYVRALDRLAREKAKEIVGILKREVWEPPFLDLGGGAGAIGRAIARISAAGFADNGSRHDGKGVLLDLPEVIDAARRIYPDENDWTGIDVIAGDFRFHEFGSNTRFGLIVMSNFLHAYGEAEARRLLEKAVSLLKPGGKLLIHDYFPDRPGSNPHKGSIYDLAMMLNTYDGQCHAASKIIAWLDAAGIRKHVVLDLDTDSSLILAGETLSRDHLLPVPRQWANMAISAGFRRAAPIPIEKIVTAPWVRLKCRYGCRGFGKNLQCPPNGRDDLETRRLLKSYRWAILLEGAPPGRRFHQRLLDLEKTAFLSGLHKAFVMGAGPCTVCPNCPGEGACLHPDLARPAMEASGIDVYQTAYSAGLVLKPVQQKGQYVKYIGLLLLE